MIVFLIDFFWLIIFGWILLVDSFWLLHLLSLTSIDWDVLKTNNNDNTNTNTKCVVQLSINPIGIYLSIFLNFSSLLPFNGSFKVICKELLLQNLCHQYGRFFKSTKDVLFIIGYVDVLHSNKLVSRCFIFTHLFAF